MENIKSTSTVGNAAEYIDWIEKSLKNAKDIVEMIERQIPEKVKRRQILCGFNNKPYAIKGDCPRCGTIDLISISEVYCPKCGQKIDWSEDEENEYKEND